MEEIVTLLNPDSIIKSLAASNIMLSISCFDLLIRFLSAIINFIINKINRDEDIKINLKVWVKVKEDWLNNDTLVKKFKLQ
mgnify:CR=1 FL=1